MVKTTTTGPGREPDRDGTTPTERSPGNPAKSHGEIRGVNSPLNVSGPGSNALRSNTGHSGQSKVTQRPPGDADVNVTDIQRNPGEINKDPLSTRAFHAFDAVMDRTITGLTAALDKVVDGLEKVNWRKAGVVVGAAALATTGVALAAAPGATAAFFASPAVHKLGITFGLAFAASFVGALAANK